MCDSCGCAGGTDHFHVSGSIVRPAVSGEVKVLRAILHENDHQASHNRAHFDAAHVLAINLMSSPGAGRRHQVYRQDVGRVEMRAVMAGLVVVLVQDGAQDLDLATHGRSNDRARHMEVIGAACAATGITHELAPICWRFLHLEARQRPITSRLR